jgi:hypothetical protein
MMLFLHWVCEIYLAKKRKKGKRKSVNQYWRDFKMLYRRVNGTFVNANDSNEVVKVHQNLSFILYSGVFILISQSISTAY